MSVDDNKKFTSTIVPGNTPEEEKANEESMKELLIGKKSENQFLGTCPGCDNNVFSNQAHVEITTVFIFEDKTGKTNTDFIHMNCYKFGGTH